MRSVFLIFLNDEMVKAALGGVLATFYADGAICML